ncbi:cytidine deaminase-like fold-containing protein [Achromobacter spanius]|uniref:cytidine deaminase-like fold-containing protein n=1 Tax=Achromobacter spanius TaxID=217203 RepID=UPI003D65D83B
MSIVVRGQDVCTHCKRVLSAAADRAGLNRLQIVDTVQNKVFEWVRGSGWMK